MRAPSLQGEVVSSFATFKTYCRVNPHRAVAFADVPCSSLNLKLAAAEGTVVQHAKHVTDLQQQMIDMQNRGIEQSRIERSGGGDHHI